MQSINELISQLKQSPEFNQFLTDKFRQISSTSSSIIQPHRRPSENSTVSDLIDQINQTVGHLIKMHMKDELLAVESLTESVHKLKKEIDSNVHKVINEIRDDLAHLAQTTRCSLIEMNEEITRNKKRHDKKEEALAFSFEALLGKVKTIEEGSSQINFDAVKAFSASCVEDKVFEESKSKITERSIEEFDKSLKDLEARMHDRYETNMRSLWNVVSDLEKRYDKQYGKEEDKINKTFTIQPRKRKSGWFS